ncbi:MAG: protoporphyrinogen oxidase [Phycicoccus sp.]
MPEPVRAVPRVAVVGGGIAGLAAALDVADALPGTEITVLEGSDRLGGTLCLAEVAGHAVDVGPEAVLATRPEATDLAARVGASADLVAPSTTAASVWSRGSLHPLPRRTVMGVPAEPALARGLLTDDEVARAVDEQRWPADNLTDDVTVGEYVGARLGRAVVERLVDPLLGGVYAGHPDRLSLRATVPALWEKAVHGERLTSTPGASGPDDVPARPPFAGLRGGVGRLPGLVAADLARRGARVRTGAVVQGLERTVSGWQVVVGSAAAPEVLEADAVLVCVPAASAARLLAGHAPVAARVLGGVETASSVVVTLAVERAGLGTLPGSGFLVPSVEGRVVKGATFSASKWGWTDALSPEVVHLRASVGRVREEPVLHRDDDDLVAVAVREVGEALGRQLPRVVDAHVQRWGGGLPQYAVGHVEAVASVRADVARLAGFAVAGATYDGVGVPAVVASARRAASEIVQFMATRGADAGRHPQPLGTRGGERR